MSSLAFVLDTLIRKPFARQIDRGVQLRTSCLYPSNNLVKVVVQGGENGFVVDDDANVLDEYRSAHPTMPPPIRILSKFVRNAGLNISARGAIFLKDVSADELEAAIVLVANASRKASEFVFAHSRRSRRSNRGEVEQLLEQYFAHWKRDAKLPGASNKIHKFDFSAELQGQKQLVLDLVVPDANSINAAVVAHLDVAQMKNTTVVQRIVYDDTLPWKSSDLELLRVGAKAIPLTRLQIALSDLATPALL